LRQSPFLLATRVLGVLVAIMAATIIISFFLTAHRSDDAGHSPFHGAPAELGLRKSHQHPGTRVSADAFKDLFDTRKRRAPATPPITMPHDDEEQQPPPQPPPPPPYEKPPMPPRREPVQPPSSTPTLEPPAGGGTREPWDPPEPTDPEMKRRQAAVKAAMVHAWSSYENKCFGQDELKPISGTCGNWLNQGLTIVDALDTLWLMGMKAEFKRAHDWVKHSLGFNVNRAVSFFETTIRVLGGLLSAYDLSREPAFLDKAKDLGQRLSAAFDTPTGLPRAEVNLATRHSTNAGWTGGASLIAEVGTVQLEFSYLSRATGDPVFAQKSQRVLDHLDSITKPHTGLYPIYVDPNTGHFANNKITMGAMGDSFYEYLLKIWLLTGKKNDKWRRMYVESVIGLREKLLTKTPDGLWYLADLEHGQKQHKMDHLACFAPAMLALGAMTGVVEGQEREQHMQMAKDLCRTCYEMYARSPLGIGPEFATFNPNFGIGEPAYHLRPEAVEAMFLLWRATKDPIYREWGWKMFQAIEQHCRVPGGYAGLSDIRRSNSKQDKQESFFLAETLKYLWLLFSPDEALPLDGPGAKVFNTECHPLGAWDIQ